VQGGPPWRVNELKMWHEVGSDASPMVVEG
jgi:hypothetical protein